MSFVRSVGEMRRSASRKGQARMKKQRKIKEENLGLAENLIIP